MHNAWDIKWNSLVQILRAGCDVTDSVLSEGEDFNRVLPSTGCKFGGKKDFPLTASILLRYQFVSGPGCPVPTSHMFGEGSILTKPTNFRAIQQDLFALLQSCDNIKKLPQIHTQIVINGLSQKNFLLVKLVYLYIASGFIVNALTVFEQIEKPSTTVWNQVIRGQSRSETPWKSLELYKRMEPGEAVPDKYTYSFVINGCARAGLLREGEQMHGKVVSNGFCSNMFVKTNLINMYAWAGGSIGSAFRLFDEMSERNIVAWNSLLAVHLRNKDIDSASRLFNEMPEKSVVSWTTMIAGCAKNGKCKQALSFFYRMQRTNMELDQVALVAALSACAELGDLELGRWIHSYVLETFWIRNQPVLVSLDNALIHMYASCGVVEDAYKVFLGMPQRTCVSWTSMITGFAKQGRGEEAIRIFNWMQCARTSDAIPDEITFLGVLCACSHAGFVDEGRHFFKCMTEIWDIKPRIEHYGCIIDLLSRAGFLDEACNLVETMPMKPNDAIWGAILSGCSIHKNVELASHVAQKLAIIELDSHKAAGYLVLLSNVYAFAKRWEDVSIARRKMVEMAVKKPPGRSWVQIDGIIHEFVADDSTHRPAGTIYKLLGDISAQSKFGHEGDIVEALWDIQDYD